MDDGARIRQYLTHKPIHRIFAGDIAVSGDDIVFNTVLGSCVSVVLNDGQQGIGGLNHFQFPKTRQKQEVTRHAGYFAEESINRLIQKLVNSGCSKRQLEAKLFGGSSMIADRLMGGNEVGTLNIAAAKDHLGRLGIPIVAMSVGGHYGRSLFYSVQDFKVYIGRISAFGGSATGHRRHS